MKHLAVLFIAFFACFAYAEDAKGAYIRKLHTQPLLTYHQLYHRFFRTQPLDAKHNGIEEEFRVWNADSNQSAIDFATLGMGNIVTFNDTYVVLFYNDDDFYKYAILTDRNATVRSVLLLGYRKGMRDWQIERDTKILHDPKGLFLVIDEQRDAEWIVHQLKGEMIVNEQRCYLVTAHTPKNFRILPTSMQALYKEEDTKLNRLYRALLGMLKRQEKKALRELQRLWVRYKERTCKLHLANATDQSPQSTHLQTKTYRCLYQKTKHRAEEIEAILEHMKFYRKSAHP